MSDRTVIPPEMNAFAWEEIAVSSAVKTLTAATYNAVGEGGSWARTKARAAMITVDTNPIRWRFDGGDPAATDGHGAIVNKEIWLQSYHAIQNFKAIRESGDAVIQVTYLR